MKCFFALWMGIPLSAQPLLHMADSLLKQGRYAVALGLYDSLLRTQTMPDTLRLRLYLKGAEAWEGVNRPKEALDWIAPAESLALQLRDTLRYAEVLAWKGGFYPQRRAYAEGEAAIQQAFRLVEAQDAQKSLLYATLWRRWGHIAQDQRDYQGSAERYRRAAQVLQALGLTEHPDYARTLISLAIAYRAQGRYAEAETLYLQVRAIQAKVLGIEHPEYARTLNNLANMYALQGRYAEAETLHLEVRAIRAKVLGTEHPEYARTLNNLAIVYKDQGRYAEAEALLSEAKAIWAKVLGTEHPDYARTLNNLANVYKDQGRYAEAEALLSEAKAIWAKVVGTEHPTYAQSINNLALVYYDQGRYEEAEALHLEVKAIWAKVLGIEHPDYAGTLNNLANVYQAQGQYAKAESLYLQVKGIQAKVLGREHPDYARTLNNLAIVYREQGRYVEAEGLLLEAKAIKARVLGTEHPGYYHSSLYNLARLYQKQRRYGEADTLWRAVVLKTFTRIRREFPMLSTAARQNLLENLLMSRLSGFQRYVVERRERADLVELGYRAARSLKGILLSSTEAMKHLVETSRDTVLRARYHQWKRLADQYAFFALQENYAAADSLWKRLQEAEREIVLRLPELRDFLPDPAGEPLTPPLRSEEALIEVMRAPAEKGDSMLYLFYLLLPEGRKHRLYLHVLYADTLWEQR
ncbi:MAG: tetratricopeptide repeat protein, partial [Bacteroidia bacterium]|nr:tetratricopeptide repeat protein [Bacteroidia bacterium]